MNSENLTIFARRMSLREHSKKTRLQSSVCDEIRFHSHSKKTIISFQLFVRVYLLLVRSSFLYF